MEFENIDRVIFEEKDCDTKRCKLARICNPSACISKNTDCKSAPAKVYNLI